MNHYISPRGVVVTRHNGSPFLTVRVDALQHGQGVNEGRDQSKDLSASQRLDADASTGATGGSVGSSGRQGNAKARASIHEGGVGHHGLHGVNLLLNLGLELANLLGITVELRVLEAV